MKCAAFALAFCLIALEAQATQADTKDQKQTGRLSITFSGAEIGLSLAVPRQDVLGFDGHAETDDDRARVAGAMSDLSNPLDLFAMPAEAGCSTISANVALSNEGFALHDATESEAPAPDATEPPEVLADYVIVCQSMDALNTIEFVYFDCFKNAQELAVEVVLPESTKTLEVTRATPLLDVTGLR